MAFVAASDGHAISEVVFGLTLNRTFTPAEIGQLIANHDSFKKLLPGVSRPPAFEFSFGGAPSQQISTGVIFDRYAASGKLEQRLRVDNNQMVINLLQYEGWPNVWPSVRQLLINTFGLMGLQCNIVSVLLQYQNIFTWNADHSEYALSELFAFDNKFVPASLINVGPLWHLHQGWFNPSELPFATRALERLTIDGLLNESHQPFVRVDFLQNLELKAEILESGQLIAQTQEAVSALNSAFENLHERNKSIVSKVLTEDVCVRIGING